jgi:hypothetical protein
VSLVEATISQVPSRQIDHGDVVARTYIVLAPLNQPDVVVLVRDSNEEVVEYERTYFFRRYPDGQLCDGHIHDPIFGARLCANRTELGPLRRGLSRAVAEISRRPSK